MSLAVFALVASPLLAFLAVLLGHRTTRRGAMELDRWRKREETIASCGGQPSSPWTQT